MPINPYIAQGSPGINLTSTLAQIAALKQRQQVIEDDRARTKLFQERDAYERERQGKADAADEKKRLNDEQRQRLAEMLPAIKAGDPTIIEEAVNGIGQTNPQLAAAIKRDPRLLVQVVEGVLGKTAENKMGAISPGDYTPESLAKYQQTGSLADLVRYVAPRQPNAPPADRQYAEWYMSLSPEDQAKVDQAQASKRADRPDRPQIVTDPYGGDPSVIVTGPNGEVMRRPVPIEGAPATAAAEPDQGPKAPPKVGTVKGGYRYVGGDPSRPESWVKVGKGASRSW